MDPGPFVGELITIIGYVMIFVGVYKIFQISSTLGEIKELLKSGQRGIAGPSAPLGPLPTDPADAYAENLLRAVNQEHVGASTERD
ncbi:MAG TPA: hypothetical protein VK687_14530 [Bryobacteraceae bacterium]|nr:hypothetical protein [Bryobacteraceae bacterium]